MPVQDQKALEIFADIAADPAVPYKIGIACGWRAQLMTGRMMDKHGVDAKDLGYITLWAPPRFLYAADPFFKNNSHGRPVMTDVPDDFSFSRIIGGETEIVYGGYSFRKGVGNSIEVRDADNPGKILHRLHDSGGPVWWSDHIAPTLIAKDVYEGKTLMVFDKSLADHPMTINDWKKRQKCPPAILLHADYTGRLKLLPDEDSRPIVEAIAAKLGLSDPFGVDRQKIVEAVAVYDGGPIHTIGNPFAPPFVKNEAGQPDMRKTIAHFETLLKPLAKFLEWKTQRITSPLAAAPFHQPPAKPAADR